MLRPPRISLAAMQFAGIRVSPLISVFGSKGVDFRMAGVRKRTLNSRDLPSEEGRVRFWQHRLFDVPFRNDG
jgi:hypothetical protein